MDLEVWRSACIASGTRLAGARCASRSHLAAEPPALMQVKAGFPPPGLVAARTRTRAADLKERYLELQPQPDAAAAPFRAKYRQLFSAEGLAGCTPADMWAFLTCTGRPVGGALGGGCVAVERGADLQLFSERVHRGGLRVRERLVERAR